MTPKLRPGPTIRKAALVLTTVLGSLLANVAHAQEVGGCRDDLGQQMLDLINTERANAYTNYPEVMAQIGEEMRTKFRHPDLAGQPLQPLEWSQEIADVACAYSQHLDDRPDGFFNHVTPEDNKDQADRIREAGITTPFGSGENLAGIPVESGDDQAYLMRAHVGLMDSEGHRHNILFPLYTHAGIGVDMDPEGNSNHFMNVTTQLFSIGKPYYTDGRQPAVATTVQDNTDDTDTDNDGTATGETAIAAPTMTLTGTTALEMVDSAPDLWDVEPTVSIDNLSVQELRALRGKAPRLGE